MTAGTSPITRLAMASRRRRCSGTRPSPGGFAYYDADLFPQWKNSLFITGLSGRSLDRIALDGESATKADHWDMGERIRAVRTGPDGALWLLEDGTSGRLLMLTPKR